MEDIYSLPPSEQAKWFRALFKYLDQQHMDLVALYHLLVPPWRRQTLVDASTELVVYPASKWYAQDLITSLSFLWTAKIPIRRYTMVRPFLKGNRQKRAELLQILEFDYSDWARRISPEERKTNPDGYQNVRRGG